MEGEPEQLVAGADAGEPFEEPVQDEAPTPPMVEEPGSGSLVESENERAGGTEDAAPAERLEVEEAA